MVFFTEWETISFLKTCHLVIYFTICNLVNVVVVLLRAQSVSLTSSVGPIFHLKGGGGLDKAGTAHK